MALPLTMNRSSCFSFVLLFVLAAGTVTGQESPQANTPAASPTYEQLSAQAATSREAGRVDDAINSYQSALKLQPDWAEGWWYVGTLNYDADHYVEAVPALQKLVALNPQSGPALAFLGLSEFEIKDYKNSLSHLQQAQKVGYGDDTELAKVATFHLAQLYNRTGQFDKTREALIQYVRRTRPPDEIKLALGLALLRIPLLANEVDPTNDALIASAGEAATMLESGDSAAAADALGQMLVEYPSTPYLHYAHATALADSGKLDEALRELATETKVSPQSALPYVAIASLNLQFNHAKTALPSARQAVLLAPKLPAAHEVLARTLKDLGVVQEATKELAIATKPESDAAEVDSVQQHRYGRSQIREDALPPIAAEDSESAFETLAKKGTAAQASGDVGAAVTCYQKALALHPHWEQGWSNLGTLYYTSARYGDAVTALKNSVAINARDGTIWALLGLSEFEIRDYKNSLIHLERGRDLGIGGNATSLQIARYHLAILLNRNGDFGRAAELLTSETASGPLHEQVKYALGMALLRIPMLPEKVDHTNDPQIQLAGDTAALLYESKYDQAFAKFQQMLEMNSSMPFLHYAYASALASISRYDEADEQLVEETKITPGSELPLLRRSSIAMRLRHPESALQFAQRALQLAPESEEAHYLLGRAWLDLGKAADAIKELETARGLAPNSPEVHFTLARAYARSGQPDAAEQERAAFERLNALVQSKRSHTGSQAYGANQNLNDIRTADGTGSN